MKAGVLAAQQLVQPRQPRHRHLDHARLPCSDQVTDAEKVSVARTTLLVWADPGDRAGDA